jgi:erythronate-4-phosphate dehydrogenase
MKIICSTNMPFALEAFQTLGETRICEGRHLTVDAVRETDLLAIRSTTRVTRELLEGSRVRFVGTATIGIDHMDIPWLEQAGIRWCSAAGCNANSVSEYVTAALLTLAVRKGLTLKGRTIGVVGVGNVGRRVVEKARALGLRVLQNDPPRARREGAAEFVELDRLLAESDIVTLHVPLEKGGSDPTWQMANRAFFDRMKKGAIFINAARGGLVNSGELMAAQDRGIISSLVLDTWEGEPAYRLDVLARADLATPHIAGHSFEGKVMGTVMVYREACRFLGVKADWSHEPLMPPAPVPQVELAAAGRTEEAILHELVRQVYDIEADDRRLRAGAMADDRQRAAHFDELRKNYPERREFPCTRVRLIDAPEGLERIIQGLGFACLIHSGKGLH